MAYWLFKTEPSDYSFDDLVRDGRTRWEGVRNPQARIHLRSVKAGDAVFVYHTGTMKAVVGIAKAVATDGEIVELAPDRPLSRPVSMPEIRKNAKLKSLDLVRNTRLSVIPVPPALWKELLRMSET